MKKHRFSIDFLKTLHCAAFSIGLLGSNFLFGQCTLPVTHLSGTQQVGCHTVEVIPEGEVNSYINCGGIGPYIIGENETANVLFNFSPPITAFRIDAFVLDYCEDGECIEEMRIEINGVPYFLTAANAGVAVAGCGVPVADISPTGTLQASPLFDYSGMENLTVSGLTINSLKVIEDCYIIVGGGWCAGISFSLSICTENCCTTDAGEIAGSPLNICNGTAANFSVPTQTNLDGDDLLQYILFTNPSDTLGSILATSNTPSFDFNPATMQTGVTYYVAAVAGNNVNGNVDLSDPCLDFSNTLTVVWQPSPTVTFTVANPEVCAGDCLTFNVGFTGTAPFNLTYTSPVGGQQTQVFNTNTGTLQICPPAGTPPGNVSLVAVSLSDANCVCE